MSTTRIHVGHINDKGNVLNAVKEYEKKVSSVLQTTNRNFSSNANETYKRLPAVARIQPMLPRTLRTFSEKSCSFPKTSSPKSENKRVKHHSGACSNAASDEKNSLNLNEATTKKLHNIAEELLITEETYVKILHFLDQIACKRFLDASKRRVISQHEVNKIFQHLSPIYMFHSVYLLPQLRERLKIWDENSRIGDIIIRAGPFLRMYALYIDNYSIAIETIKTWKERSHEFARIVEAVESLPDCENLPLETHLITPVQRTPRYKMLLESYLKELPPTSSQRNEIEAALAVVEFAASHSNSYIAQKEKTWKLVEVYKKLVQIDFNTDNFSRELIKEGNVIKIAARNGKQHERYLYLFSDSLLYCKDCNSLQKLHGKVHEVSLNLKLVGVAASIVDGTEPRFFIQGIEKQNEFLCRSVDERDNWVASINKAVANQIEKKNSFRRVKRASSKSKVISKANVALSIPTAIDGINLLEAPSYQKDFLKEDELGTRAPKWIKDDDVTMCMRCNEPFHPIWRRRHHCRACGRLVCASCSSKVFLLAYQPHYSQRVCDPCFRYLQNGKFSTPEDHGQKKAEQSLDEIFLLSGYLHFEEKNGEWIKIWCEVPTSSPHVCFCYKTKTDLKPYIIVSFVRCKVTTLERSEHKHSFQVSTFLGEKHVFAAFESREKEDWMNYIINFNMENTVQSFSINRNAIAANLNFKQSNEQRQHHN